MATRKDTNKNPFENKEFTETLKYFISFFEKNVIPKKGEKVILYLKIQDELEKSKIKEKISYLSKEVLDAGYPLTTSFAKSLSIRINSYIKLDADTKFKDWKKKLSELIDTYYSFVSSIKAFPNYKKFIENNSEKKKSILVVGTTSDIEDKLKVNDEINAIFDICEDQEDLFVYRIYGCSFEVYNTILKTFDFDMIHIGGHGNEKSLLFIGKDISPKVFINQMNSYERKRDLIFLNCCYTYVFVQNVNLSFSDYTICYEEKLNGDLGLRVAKYFYRRFISNRNIPLSWQGTIKGIKDKDISNYYLLSTGGTYE